MSDEPALPRAGTALESELMATDLSEPSICALFTDGIEEADHTMVRAIGVDPQGRRHLLGLREPRLRTRSWALG